ncbi:MAG: hypothetical protein QHC78_19455 [Pigmentiphaga sp.]|uniref:hypothetical protein n=1 Tax=Pigmentiphaga sp. TaxID=1977564 RepID=UPI0029BB3E5E|nr:hypothetical protein [Pigmentiphaga sp.]MDX3907868.1 hypothetical protein [Pigmentiphaga sp.]
MSSHSKQGQGDRTQAPSTKPAPDGLPEAAVEETGNEDPGSELTELGSGGQVKPSGSQPSARPDDPAGEQTSQERTIGNHPVDPNSMPSRIGLPVGVDKDTAADPGNQTPDAPKTDNRS